MDERLEVFKDAGLEWPPKKGASPAFKEFIGPYLTDREYEVFFYSAKIFPHPQGDSERYFLDTNYIMKFNFKQCGPAAKSDPWKQDAPLTLVGSSRLVMRSLPAGKTIDATSFVPLDQQWEYHVVTGVELMAMVG